jgi:dinuclear metal center YbgI/SA1388 family protein
MVTVAEIAKYIEDSFPLNYQESYDNSGLQIGIPNMPVNSILLALDVTEDVIEEACSSGANLIITHHPLIFGGIKKITGRNYTERILQRAIKNDIAIYSCHTNIDNLKNGVSYRIAEKLGLKETSVLQPLAGDLVKLVTFIPTSHLEKVRTAIFEAGAGNIGNYDCCSFNAAGSGTFRANEAANPFVGKTGELHLEPETRFETIFPKNIQNKILKALLTSHPYEEVAYDLYSLQNTRTDAGAGVIGTLKEPVDEKDFLKKIKEIFQIPAIRHTQFLNKKINKVAICGGSGSFLLPDAVRAGADIFISGDFKYHQFFDADKKILIADIGHFESEQYTLEIFYELLTKKLSNFAICFTKVKTNPINYYI